MPHVARIMRCAAQLEAPRAPSHLSRVERRRLRAVLEKALARQRVPAEAAAYLQSVVGEWDKWTPFARQVTYSVLWAYELSVE